MITRPELFASLTAFVCFFFFFFGKVLVGCFTGVHSYIARPTTAWKKPVFWLELSDVFRINTPLTAIGLILENRGGRPAFEALPEYTFVFLRRVATQCVTYMRIR